MNIFINIAREVNICNKNKNTLICVSESTTKSELQNLRWYITQYICLHTITPSFPWYVIESIV